MSFSVVTTLAGITILFSCYYISIIAASSMGEYYTTWKEFGKCPKEWIGTNQIEGNFRLSKKSTAMEVVGNYTLLIPIDDSISMDINFWKLSSSGGWLPNAFSMSFSRACHDALTIVGQGWREFLHSMKIPLSCPISKGVYMQPGFDVQKFLSSSPLPRTFIFGSYKIVIKYVKTGQTVGCVYTIIYVKPTWEKNG